MSRFTGDGKKIFSICVLPGVDGYFVFRQSPGDFKVPDVFKNIFDAVAMDGVEALEQYLDGSKIKFSRIAHDPFPSTQYCVLVKLNYE